VVQHHGADGGQPQQVEGGHPRGLGPVLVHVRSPDRPGILGSIVEDRFNSTGETGGSSTKSDQSGHGAGRSAERHDDKRRGAPGDQQDEAYHRDANIPPRVDGRGSDRIVERGT
jgi:hypothetical protein